MWTDDEELHVIAGQFTHSDWWGCSVFMGEDPIPCNWYVAKTQGHLCFLIDLTEALAGYGGDRQG